MDNEWVTIPVRKETKNQLEELKKKTGMTYDALIVKGLGLRKSIQYDLSKTVPPETGYLWNENYRVIDSDGIITQVVLHFPKGCKALVYVRVGVAGKDGLHWICPESDFIALDDTTQSYSVYYPVHKGDRIVAEIYNYDQEYEHRIGIIVTVEKFV